MERIIRFIGEYSIYFDRYGNYILIPLFILMFLLDWRISKSKLSSRTKKPLRTLLTVSAFVFGGLIYAINFPLKPMITSLSKIDGSIGAQMVSFDYLNVATGQKETIEDHDKPIILLNLWATYCPPCIMELPDLKKIETTFSDELAVIAVSDESPERIQQFISKIERPSIIGSQPDNEWINPEKFLPLTIVVHKGVIKKRFFGRKTYDELVGIIEEVKSN